MKKKRTDPLDRLMKKLISSKINAHLIRPAFYVALSSALWLIELAFGQRQPDAAFQNQNPTGFVCYGCPSNGWHTGPDMPITAVRTVGVYFWPNGNFYAVGGRSMDGVGNDFAHPFEFNRGTNSWSIKSATYPDNQVSDMACCILTDSGTNYIYCVGGSAGGQTTSTASAAHQAGRLQLLTAYSATILLPIQLKSFRLPGQAMLTG